MTTDSRKIQLETGVDATGAKAGFQQVKDAAKDMATSVQAAGKEAAKGIDGVGNGAEASAQKVDRATSNLIGSIQRATAAQEAGKKSGADFFESLAKQRDIPADALKPYLDQLRAVEAQAKATAAATRTVVSAPAPALTTSLGASTFVKPLGNPSTSLGASPFGAIADESQKAATVATQSLQRIGVSAGQTANALRGVPAQFTDIVTSLQGGQAPLTVLLQQGGQLKDMFGGIGPAAKALGGYVLGLINPFTVAAAAVATLGIAYAQGAKESQEYNKALILTGNYLGLTVTQLQTYATAISKTVGTQGAAAEALTALASSGKIAASSLTAVGTAVVMMNRVLGTSVDEATATFVKLADEPTKASVKLNESMHYLNLATYERIRALEEQGRKEEAAALAQKSLADATTDRLKSVEAGTGLLEKAWRSLADGAKGAWDAMLGIGRQQSIGDALSNAQSKLAESRAQASKSSVFASFYAPAISKQEADVAGLSRKAMREQENAFAEGERTRNESAKIGASDRLKTLSDEVRSNADKRKKAIADLDRDFKTLGKPLSGDEYTKLVANINDKFKDPKGATPKAFQDDAATKMLESLRQQEASLKEQLSTNEKLTASEKERAKFVQLVADLKEKKQLTVEQKSLLANQGAIKAQLDTNVAIEKQIVLKLEAAKADEKAKKDAEDLKRTFEGINIAMASANETRREQYSRTLATVGLGDRARAEVEAERGIFNESQKNIRQATKAASDKGLLDSDSYKEEVAKIKASLAEALSDQKAFFAAEKEAREDWSTGAKAAVANYIDGLNDAAGKAKELTTSLLGGLTDSLTGVLMGDKGSSFKDIGKKIAEQIVRGVVEQNITKPFAEWLQSGLKDGDSIVSQLLGGLMGKGSAGGLLGGATGAAGSSAAAAATSALATAATSAAAALASLAATATGSSGASSLGSLFSAGNTASSGFGTGSAFGNQDFGGFFAGGGNPPMGRISVVGERGPELFVPRQPGTIIPNEALGGNSTVVHLTQSFADGTSRKTTDQAARQASAAIQRAQRNT